MKAQTVLKMVTIAVLLLAATRPFADDLGSSERFLCSAAQATRCYASGDCVSSPPWELNIPQFIEIDLGKKRLATTEASGENRETLIKNLEREDGLIFLQGVEAGRAFSFVISEQTGMASIAVAREGMTVTVFGPCTPMPESE